MAADSGCGKSTFMRRLTSIFGGDTVGPLGGGFDNGGWETNSLVSDLTTVLCLDDYHLNDRGGRKVWFDTRFWLILGKMSCSKSSLLPLVACQGLLKKGTTVCWTRGNLSG